MAFQVSQIRHCSTSNKPALGKHIFNILTSGMYNDPMMIYREYIQNAVDSIDLAEKMGFFVEEKPSIRINLIPETRTVTIYDNGTGISNDSVQRILSNIALSDKDPSVQRGFRGIGRLSGLAYCREVVYETRTLQDEFVSVFRWDKTNLEKYLKENGNFDLDDLINSCVEVSFREPKRDEGDHFFRVSLNHISPFYKDQLLFLPEIKNHIAITCPVPYKQSFEPFSTQIRNNLKGFGGFKEYLIFVNGEKIFKPYDKKVSISENVELNIDSIKFLSVPGISGKPIAKGWVAISNFPGSLPKRIQVRGIRIRQGNLALGDEFFCSDFFPEQRFTTWNIGEIHCNSCLIPNARRDGFETNLNCEKLFEALIQLGKFLAQEIRNHSKIRSIVKNLNEGIHSLENEFQTLAFVGEKRIKHFEKKLTLAKQKLEEAEKKCIENQKMCYFSQSLGNIKAQINKMDSYEVENICDNNPIGQLTCLTKEIVQEICGEIYEKHGCEVLRSVIDCFERNVEPQRGRTYTFD